MKQFSIELFASNAHEIVFLHVLSAIIWVGGMIAIRLAVHPTIQSIDDPKIKLGKTLALMSKFFNIVIPFIILILLTALVMVFAMGSSMAVQIKETIWIIMAANFTLMYLKRRKAQKFFDAGDLALAKASVVLIPKLLLPLNIVLGIVALWLGVSLRGL
jgi:uncharacterized membrane protein